MNDAEAARHFLDRIVPSAFADVAPSAHAFRCRFRVIDAGAWEINLGRWVFGPTCVDANVSPGGYDAVIYLTAADLAELRAQRVSAREVLGRKGRKASGDTARAFDLLDALGKGPPFTWPPSLRVQAAPAGFMRGTERDLLDAFPACRRRLAQPRKVQRTNPFTHELVDVETFDPGEDAAAATFPCEPPLPFVIAPMGSHWWEELFDLYLAVCTDDESARRLRHVAVDLGLVTEEIFPRALFGFDLESAVCEVPQRFSMALTALTDTRCIELVKEQTRDTKLSGPYARLFRDLRTFARSAEEIDQALWFWGPP